MKRGFTLVELSIVLVIIGLLIGGMLVAQSMISTAKVNAVAMQIGQFDAGVMSFKTKYNYLPGDAPSFGGDGNGMIGLTIAMGWNPPVINTFGCEIANFWNNMDQQQYPGLSTCSVSGAAPVATGINKNVPLSKMGSPNAFFIATAIADPNVDCNLADKVNPRNYYAILDANQAQSSSHQFTMTGSTIKSAVKVVDLAALDKKIDDGTPSTGNVVDGSIGGAYGGCGGGLFLLSGYQACQIAGAYNFSNNTYQCTPVIRMGAQVGDPQ